MPMKNVNPAPTWLPSGGMIQSIMPQRKGLANVCPNLRKRVASFLDSVYAPHHPKWCYLENPTSKRNSNMETAVWALSCLQQLGCRDRIACVKSNVAAAIDAYYDPQSRTYRHENIHTQSPDDIGAWRLHNDAVARTGLDILGVAARPGPDNPSFLKCFPWAQPPREDLAAWLSRCWQTDTRAATKEIYQYLALYCRCCAIAHCDQFDGHVTAIMEFLESKRDPASGFIGMTPGGDLGWCMRGYRNFALGFLWPMSVPEPWRERMIASTLSCQRDDGLFHDGSMCANMDAVQLLAEYALQTGDRRDEVIDASRKCIAGIFRILALPCGGFRYTLTDCPNPEADGYGDAMVTNGTAFVMNTLRYWQAIDPQARENLAVAMKQALH